MILLLFICLATAMEARAEESAKVQKEASDLERSLEDLTGAVCEHQKKTYTCDECRYEVGFVRAPSQLFEEGLIRTVVPTPQTGKSSLTLTGEIRFDEQSSIQLSSLVDGVIRKTHVNLGDKVVKGQPLLEIESVAIGDEQAGYAEAQALLSLATRNFDRAQVLFKENIASEKNYLQAKQELEAARIRAQSAKSKLNRLGADDKTKGRLIIRAPIDGTVLTLRAVQGEMAKAGDTLLTVGDDSTLVMWADVYERDIPAVKQAQAGGRKPQAAVTVKAYAAEEFPGVLELISPVLNESSRTLKARITVKNRDGRLLAGMFATALISFPESGETMSVPKEAVLQDEGESFVFVRYENDYFVRRKVTPGQTFSGQTEIHEGLDPVQVVAAEGAFLMKSDVLRSKMGAGCAD